MPLKMNLNESERYGLSAKEIEQSQIFLRKNHLKSVIRPPESLKLYELYMIGYTFVDIQSQYPQYPLEQIILTAAICEWPKDRDNMLFTLRDKIQAKIMKSLVDQVEFLTSMVTVANVEHLEQMRNYIANPTTATPPEIRISSIKDYKETVDILSKITQSTPHSVAGQNNTPLYAGSNNKKQKPFPTSMPKKKLPAKLLYGDIEKLARKEKEELEDEASSVDGQEIDINSLASDD